MLLRLTHPKSGLWSLYIHSKPTRYCSSYYSLLQCLVAKDMTPGYGPQETVALQALHCTPMMPRIDPNLGSCWNHRYYTRYTGTRSTTTDVHVKIQIPARIFAHEQTILRLFAPALQGKWLVTS